MASCVPCGWGCQGSCCEYSPDTGLAAASRWLCWKWRHPVRHDCGCSNGYTLKPAAAGTAAWYHFWSMARLIHCNACAGCTGDCCSSDAALSPALTINLLLWAIAVTIVVFASGQLLSVCLQHGAPWELPRCMRAYHDLAWQIRVRLGFASANGKLRAACGYSHTQIAVRLIYRPSLQLSCNMLQCCTAQLCF